MTVQSLSPRVQTIVDNIRALDRAELRQLFDVIVEWLASAPAPSQPHEAIMDGHQVLKYFGCWPDMPDDFVAEIMASDQKRAGGMGETARGSSLRGRKGF